MTTHGPTEWVRVFELPNGAVAHVIAGFGHHGGGSLVSFCVWEIQQVPLHGPLGPWFAKFEGGKTEVAVVPLSESVRPICKKCVEKIRVIQAEFDAVGIYYEGPK